jgi:arsenical pump membrane protein
VPTALVELLAVLGLAVMLVVAFLHPPGWVEAAVGVGAAAMVVAVGALDIGQAEAQVRKLLPVVGFLAAILVVAEMCAREGLFDAVGARIAGASRRRPGRMLLLAFLIAAVTTTVLSLDATVVLLTPVLAASAAAAVVSARPMEFAGVRMANSASLLFPVSNLTNLLALPELHLSFLGFAARTAPAWLAVILVEYVGHRIVFASDLQTSDVEPVPVTPVAVPSYRWPSSLRCWPGSLRCRRSGCRRRGSPGGPRCCSLPVPWPAGGRRAVRFSPPRTSASRSSCCASEWWSAV